MKPIATIVGTFAAFILADTITPKQMPWAITIGIAVIIINAKKLGLTK